MFDYPGRRWSGGSVDRTTGRVFLPRFAFPLPVNIIDATDPIDAETITTVGPTQTHSVTHSHKCAYPVTQTTTIAGFSREWISHPDLGRNWLQNQSMHEDVGGAGGAEFLHNPTMGGAAILPAELNGPEPQSAQAAAFLRPSIPVHDRFYREGIEIVSEGCVIPVDFASRSESTPASADDHGGDARTVAVWPWMREYSELRVNFNGVEGLHRLVHWIYDPRMWSAEVNVLQLQVISGLSMRANGTESIDGPAFFYDLERRVRTSLGVDWAGNNSLTLTSQVNSLVWAGDVVRTDPSPVPSGYAAAIIEEASAPSLAIGQAVRLYGIDQIERKRRSHRQIVRKSVTGDTTYDVISFQLQTGAGNFTPDRFPGWVGQCWWYVTDTTVDGVQARLDDIRSQGLLDRECPFTVPQHVLDGIDPW